MKKQIVTLLVCIFLVGSWFSGIFVSAQAPAGDGMVEVALNIRGTFLRAMDDWPYFGPGDYQYDENLELQVGTHTDFRVEEPIIIDLQAEGFNEGDKIYISWLGGLYPDGAWNPSNPGSIGLGLKENDDVSHKGLLGLFSITSTLDNDLNSLNRVSGAIDFGDDYFTPDTWWQDGRPELAQKLSAKNIDWYTGPMKTDIPEDFRIFPHTGMKIEIPRNAKFLFLSTIDPYYRDNYEGPNGLVVTIEKDSDEDGIPDHWEMNGIDIDDDGITDLDLPALGASWEHKDVFVEVDYMGSSGGHDHNPNPTAISDVIQAFANAPVNNPDGTGGINLHVLVDQEIPHDFEITWGEFLNIKNTMFGTEADQNDANKNSIRAARKLVFHYCLFIHTQTGGTWSGRGEVRGNDFLVSLGAFSGNTGTIKDQAATFMHELGHNLGLRHAGNKDNPNYKPNYVSIMNYLFQFDRRVPDRAMDFSVGDKSVLTESNLDENNGIGDLVKTAWWLPNGTLARSVGALPIDWNGDGSITANVKVNLNNNPSTPSAEDDEVFTDFNDWANLFYRFRGTAAFASGAQAESHEELTFEQVEAMAEEAKNIIEVPTPDSYKPNDEKDSDGLRINDKITFQSNRDGNYEIYVMNADGSRQTRLTNNNYDDKETDGSPDGTKIVFISNRDGNYEIYVMNTDGSRQTRLTNNNYADEQPHWSPDGTKIAFASNRDGNKEIYVMNADGSGQTRLTNNTIDDGLPRWSPDGNKIAFESNRDGHWEIYIMNADGSSQTNLTSNYDENPSWSPDGTKIVFASNRGENQQIYVMNADGSGQTRITNNNYDDGLPSWSPDGTKIAYNTNRDGNNEIYAMNADGSGQTRLTNNGASDYWPSWESLTPESPPFPMIWVAAIAVVVIGIAVFLVLKRKKSKSKIQFEDSSSKS